MINEPINRHRLLVQFLSQFDAYKDNEGTPVFKFHMKCVSGYASEEFTCQQINRAVVLLCDLFNLTGGSIAGKFDLYRLFQAYLLDERKRIEINEVLGV